MHGGAVGFQVFLMRFPEMPEVRPEVWFQAEGERDDTVFPAFGIVDLDGCVIEVEVFDAEGHGFADAQSGTVHELGSKLPRAIEFTKEFVDFGATEDGGRASVFLGHDRGIDDEFAMLEDSAVEEYEGV